MIETGMDDIFPLLPKDMDTSNPSVPEATVSQKDLEKIATFDLTFAMPQIEECQNLSHLEGITTYLKELTEKALTTLENGKIHEIATPKKVTEIIIASTKAKERLLDLKFENLKNELLQQNTNTPTSTNEEFKTVKSKRRRPNYQPPSSKITSQNQFSILEDLTDEITIETPTLEMETPKEKKKWIPPIIIEKVRNSQELMKAINKEIPETNIHAQMKGSDLKVFPPTIEAHRKIQTFINANNLGSHTYELPDEREMKVVIRGLPIDHSIPEIMEDLKSKNLPVKFIQILPNRITKEPMPLFLVTLDKTKNAKDIYNIEYIGYLRVTIQPQYRRRRAAQCYRCQLFNHSSKKCNRTPRCVKCGENHESSKCLKPKTTPAKCCNCGGPHPANYSGCPKNPDNLPSKRQPKTNFWEERSKLNQLNSEDSTNFPPLNDNPPSNTNPTDSTDVVNQLTSQFSMKKIQLICDGFHSFCEKMSTSRNILETAVHAITIIRKIATAWNVQDDQ